MKKLTANNDPNSNKPKQSLDMQSINIEEASKKMGAGGRFTKIGGGGGAIAGRGFKKVGVAVAKDGEKKEETVVETTEQKIPVAVAIVEEKQVETEKHEDVIMADDDEEEAITWEEYDFTKPTGCDHSTCEGCKTDGIWSGEWVAV
jgi:hypothetical protein